MMNVSPTTRLVSMPMSCAAVGFCATARIAVPRRVRLTNQVSRIISGTVMTATITSLEVS